MSDNTTSIDTLAGWLAAYQKAKDTEAQARDEAQQYRDTITSYLAEHNAEIGLINNQPAVKHTPIVSHRFDQKAFRHDHPEWAAHYTTRQTTHRFTVIEP